MPGTLKVFGVLSVAALASAQAIPTASQCPTADGQTITDSNGSTYKVTCSSDNSVGSYANTNAGSSYLDCMTACDAAASAGCQGFTYVGGTGGVGSGTCWLKKSMGTYTAASTSYICAVKISGAVSSAKTNVASTLTTSVSSTASISAASAASAANLCPSSNFTSYADTAGNNWQILCGFDTSPGSFGSTSASTLQSCLQACTATANCAAVTYIGTACYFKKSFSSLITKSSANSAFLINTQKYQVPVAGNSKASSGCGAALPAGVQLGGASTTFQLTSSGVVRSFNVHVPTSYKNNKASPLIIGYHGRSNNQLSVESDSQLSSETWNPYAIAVYPLGINVGVDVFIARSIKPKLTRDRKNGRVIQIRQEVATRISPSRPTCSTTSRPITASIRVVCSPPVSPMVEDSSEHSLAIQLFPSASALSQQTLEQSTPIPQVPATRLQCLQTLLCSQSVRQADPICQCSSSTVMPMALSPIPVDLDEATVCLQYHTG